MRYYELLYIVNPNLEDDKVNSIIAEIGNELNKYKVSIINHNLWGKKRLAYPIKNNRYGIYILLQFSAEKYDFLIEFERFLILNKSVIRHQLVRLDEEPAKVEDIGPVVEDTDSQEDESPKTSKEDSKIDSKAVDKVDKVEKKEETAKTEETEKAEGDEVEKAEDEKEIEDEKKEEDK